MNPLSDDAFLLLSIMVEGEEELFRETNENSFGNKWLQEHSRLDVDNINVAIDELEREKAISVSRTLGQGSFDFKEVALQSKGKVLYKRYKSKPMENNKVEPTLITETKPSDTTKVFVVHGRNDKARDALFQFLRSIGLKPIEWSQAIRATGKGAPYIGEILDAAFSTAQAVVVLMTPDDMAFLRTFLRGDKEPAFETEPTPQARPNVLFEAGMAMGRHPDRTILAELGDLRPFSDVGGRHVIRLNNSSQRRHDLADRLEMAGCAIDLSGRDWYQAGDFDAALRGAEDNESYSVQSSKPNPSGPLLGLSLIYKPTQVTAERHEYILEFRLKNTGSTTIIDYRVDIEFPHAFVNLSTTYGVEVREKRTATHMLLRKIHQPPHYQPKELYPGDEVLILTMDYFVTAELFHSEAMNQVLRATIYSTNMPAVVIEKAMRELSDFS